ncbi:MAG: Hsp20/alpha crystallin family protein [Rickettsiales bacterium]|nr:Hsp20/alpha crystallin family protein [Rickettsiales bacterium]
MTKNLPKHSNKVSKNQAWGSLHKMHDAVDNMFREFWSDDIWPSGKDNLLTPKSDIMETKNEYKVLMEMPGVEEKDIEVSLDNGILKITGKKDHSEETKDATVHTIEREYGSFTKMLQLPDNVAQEKIKANFKNGVLKLVIPKTDESKRGIKKISITK